MEREVLEKEDRIEDLEEEIIQLRSENKEMKNTNVCDESNKKTVARNSRAIKGQEEVLRDQRKITDKTIYDKSDPLNQVMTLPKAFVR